MESLTASISPAQPSVGKLSVLDVAAGIPTVASTRLPMAGGLTRDHSSVPGEELTQ